MDQSKAEMPKVQPLRLQDALREARLASTERGGVVIDLKDAEIARLELLNDALDPVFADIPASIELFDRGITRGERPRLWIDMIAYVVMEREERVYRFMRETRHGPRIIAESPSIDLVVREITRYIARRIIEHERVLAAASDSARLQPVARERGKRHTLLHILFGIVLGVVGVFAAAWIAGL